MAKHVTHGKSYESTLAGYDCSNHEASREAKGSKMFARKHETSWAKVVTAVAVLKLMPMKKMLLGVAAMAGVAGAVYAIQRLRCAQALPSET